MIITAVSLILVSHQFVTAAKNGDSHAQRKMEIRGAVSINIEASFTDLIELIVIHW